MKGRSADVRARRAIAPAQGCSEARLDQLVQPIFTFIELKTPFLVLNPNVGWPL